MQPVRPVFNHQAVAEDGFLPQQMMQKVKMLCRTFLPGEESVVTKALAGAHEGNKAAPR